MQFPWMTFTTFKSGAGEQQVEKGFPRAPRGCHGSKKDCKFSWRQLKKKKLNVCK